MPTLFGRLPPTARSGALAAVLTVGMGTLSACAEMSPAASAQSTLDRDGTMTMIAGWPASSRMAAMDMMEKYGPPNAATPTMLMWMDNGPWKWTKISNMEVPHNFPMPHPDVLQQAIDYQAPVDMFDDLARYDGSVMLERTKGEMSARCDKEGANFLALNLANDVATGKRSVEDARAYYTNAMKTFKETKRMDPYMQGFRFQVSDRMMGDPDRSTI